MSSGVFDSAVYESEAGAFYPCRVQPETITAFNPTASGTPDAGVGRLKLSKGRREFGVVPRVITGVWTTAPTGYKTGGTVRIPIFTPSAFADITEEDVITYLGGTLRVSGRIPEKTN